MHLDRQYITLALHLDLSCIPIASLPCNYSSIPPPVICLTYVRNRENIPGWVPPSSVSCSTALGHTRHCVCHVLYCVTLLALYLLFPPPSLFDRPPRPPPPTLLCTATSSTTTSFRQNFQAH